MKLRNNNILHPFHIKNDIGESFVKDKRLWIKHSTSCRLYHLSILCAVSP